MEGKSPVVWEWSSALHRGWWFLLLPTSHPRSPPHTPHSTYLIPLLTPSSLLDTAAGREDGGQVGVRGRSG